MRRGYFTPPVLIILAIIIFAVAIVIAINADFVKRIKKEPSSTPSSTTQQPNLTPDETLTWETYRATGKYEIKYPLEYYSVRSSLSIVSVDWPGVVTFEPNDIFSRKQPFAITHTIDIAISANTNKLDLSNYEEFFGNGAIIKYTREFVDPMKIKKITLGGVEALRLDNLPAGQSGITSHIIVLRDDKIYEIVVSPQGSTGDGEVREKNMPIVEQILSTFKFLD